MHNILLIHDNNVPFLEKFEKILRFESNNDNIDEYITNDVIPKIQQENIDMILIKDTLSMNYLDLYGLRVAYHIRLSQELEAKRFVPIVILSELDSYTLNKLTPMARIFFTKNIFLLKNSMSAILDITNKELPYMSEREYREHFLNMVDIEAPKESNHDIANEWSIHLWAEYLRVETKATQTNNQKIASTLYFKYLKSLYLENREEDNGYKIKKLGRKGKILYIDDEWDKGWKDILDTLFARSEGIEFTTFEHNYQDANKFKLIPIIVDEVVMNNPDVVILDLRLVPSDHNDTDNLNSLTGIQLVRKIKKINPGIQIIMLTATSKSIILEKLYDYGILGYIKKEHPNDRSISTTENIDKLVRLIDDGLKRKYLKQVWNISCDMITQLKDDPFKQHFKNFEHKDYSESINILKNEAQFVFDILNGSMHNKLNYALISLASSLDALQNIFIECTYNRQDKECYYLGGTIPDKSLYGYILYILKKMNHRETFQVREKILKRLIKARNDYIHSNDGYQQVQPLDILRWFELINEIINMISKPKKLKVHKQESMHSLGDFFKDKK